MNTEPQSITGLFEAEEGGLLRLATGIVRRQTVAEELVQDGFLRLHRMWDQVDNPRGWIYRCVRNLALNHLRDRPKEAELDQEAVPADQRLPREAMGRTEAIGMVRMLLAEMPDEDRSLVLLKYHEELKYGEISKRTGLSVGNVGFRLHHVLKGLADGLRRAGIEGSEG